MLLLTPDVYLMPLEKRRDHNYPIPESVQTSAHTPSDHDYG